MEETEFLSSMVYLMGIMAWSLTCYISRHVRLSGHHTNGSYCHAQRPYLRVQGIRCSVLMDGKEALFLA